MTDKDELVALAEQAAVEVELGWCQRRSTDGENVCAIGALHAAAQGREYILAKIPGYWWTEATKTLSIKAFEILGSLPHKWNDEPGRTQAEVADMWRMVAKELANDSEYKDIANGD